MKTGAALAASLAVGAGIDHALEEQKVTAIAAANAQPPAWLPLVPAGMPTTRHFVATLGQLGGQPVPCSAGGIVGYLVLNDGESGDASDGPVTAMSAACTHIGCLVNWEGSDRTFRCPCHGGVLCIWKDGRHTFHDTLPRASAARGNDYRRGWQHFRARARLDRIDPLLAPRSQGDDFLGPGRFGHGGAEALPGPRWHADEAMLLEQTIVPAQNDPTNARG